MNITLKRFDGAIRAFNNATNIDFKLYWFGVAAHLYKQIENLS